MSGTDDPDLAVTLPRSVWVSLVSSLAQRPYAEVAELIAEIVRQSDEQAEAASPPPRSPAASPATSGAGPICRALAQLSCAVRSPCRVPRLAPVDRSPSTRLPGRQSQTCTLHLSRLRMAAH